MLFSAEEIRHHSVDFQCYCRRIIIALFIFRNLTTVSEGKVFLISPLVCLCACVTFGLILPSKTQTTQLLVRCWLLSEFSATKTAMSTALKQIMLKDACR